MPGGVLQREKEGSVSNEVRDALNCRAKIKIINEIVLFESNAELHRLVNTSITNSTVFSCLLEKIHAGTPPE